MKRTILILVVLALLLAGCIPFTEGNAQSASDAEMATRVARLLATMTTPTQEIDFPPTPTALQTIEVITATPVATVESTLMEAGAEKDEAVTLTATGTVEITATPTVASGSATPTVTATLPAGDPSLALGNPTGTDSFDSPNDWMWPTGADEYINVTFSNGYMQMTGLTKFAGWRLPLINQQVNTYIELTANSGACVGKDSYGVIFRVPVFKDPTQGYLFEVTCDGYYRLWKWDSKAAPNGLAIMLVPWSQSSAIQTGANQSNRLGVMIKDSTFTLYVNGVQLASASDPTYTAGFFGAFVHAAETMNYTVNFDTMKYWENP